MKTNVTVQYNSISRAVATTGSCQMYNISHPCNSFNQPKFVCISRAKHQFPHCFFHTTTGYLSRTWIDYLL